MGVANKKSVAWHIAQTLEEEGANVIFSVRSGDRKNSLDKLLTGKSVYICDVEKSEDIERLKKILQRNIKLYTGWSIRLLLLITQGAGNLFIKHFAKIFYNPLISVVIR